MTPPEAPLSHAVFVTGAVGFIGSHVSEALLARGDRVFGFDNFDPFYDRRIKERNLASLSADPAFSFLEGDIRDASALARWGEGIPPDALIHLAAKAGVRPSVADPVGYADVNVHGTIRLLEWARERKVPKVLFASSSSVYGGNTKVPFSEDDFVDHPVSPYAATKKAGELLCHTYCHLYGMSVAALRFFTVYGPRQRPEMAIHKFTRRILEGKVIDLYGDGSSRRDYTYIEDIVAGVLGALTAPPGYRVYNLGESATISLSELVALIEKACGKPAVRRFKPPQPGDVPVTYADISLARKEIGYDPRTPIELGITRFIEWYRNEATTGPT
ncbi:MAG TPA: GDP-mannose 4,6-dehydratase [Thermodesulfobacteriota bacterium]|nr:GDP-mannose 4,6-dehydratase [Deltaproteobacteria bacterium]HQT97219.1 GDP-mannose 4,6-dehydratase [Thermodesulfobacteriota bacterium]